MEPSTLPQKPSLSSLPQELLDHILELTTEDEHLSLRHVTASHVDLKSFALVAHAWTVTSQRLLWRRVVLDRNVSTQRWLATPVRYKMLELHMVPGSRTNAGVSYGDVLDLDSVLERMDGLEVLTLRRCVLWLKSLGKPTLSGLKHLRLFAPVLCDRVDTPPIAFPFSISTLTIKASREMLPPPLLQSLLLSSTNSLTTLNLEGRDPVNLAPLLPSFPLIASNLTSLSLSTPWTSLIPHLATCTSLTHLTLLLPTRSFAPHVETIFRVLPSPLHTLSIEQPYPGEVYQILRTLLEHVVDWPAVNGLRVLRLARSADQAMASLQVDLGGRATLEERGIKVVYAPREDGSDLVEE